MGPKPAAGDALALIARHALDAMDPATRDHPDRTPSERYLVNIHLDAQRPDLPTHIHLGPLLPDHLRDQLLCDTLIRTWITTTNGNTNLGRTRRTADARLRTVTEHRDHGCANCGSTRNLHNHHINPWPDGGPTDATNLITLCLRCHRNVHLGHYRITTNPDGTHTLTDRHGRPLTYQPPHPHPPTPPPPTSSNSTPTPTGPTAPANPPCGGA